jgi:ribose transport system substrate-binding protein
MNEAMKKTPRLSSLLPVLSALALAGCKQAPARKHAGTPEDPFVIGMSQCNRGEPWRVQMDEDVKQAAAKLPNVKVVFKDAQNESLTQRAQIEELLAQGIDLLLVSPKESAPLTRPVAEAFDKGVPVIVLDRAVEGDKFTTFIGADNRKIGREAGKWIATALGGKGKIVELEGLQTSTPGRDRHQGFLEGVDLAAHPGIQIVFTADMEWLEPKARSEMESALGTQKEIDLVYAHNDPGAHGAYLAARQAGRKARFVGIDALPHEGVKYVEEGILDATFLYPTGGPEAVALAVRILGGEKPPRKVVLGTRIYTKDNAARGGEEIN